MVVALAVKQQKYSRRLDGAGAYDDVLCGDCENPVASRAGADGSHSPTFYVHMEPAYRRVDPNLKVRIFLQQRPQEYGNIPVRKRGPFCEPRHKIGIAGWYLTGCGGLLYEFLIVGTAIYTK
jgi:hypothetical protein